MSEPMAHCSTANDMEDSDGGAGSGMEDEVAKIIGKQFMDGKPEYLVKWKSSAEETWEPKENLRNCAELLGEYEKKWKGSKAMQRKTVNFATIEKILERRIANGRREYRVKWRGCAESDSTWEPSENFKDPELVKEFELEQQSKRMRLSAGAPKRGRSRSSNSTTTKNRKKVATKPVAVAKKGKGAGGRRSAAKKGIAGGRSASPTNEEELPEPSSPSRMMASPSISAQKTPPPMSSSSSSGSSHSTEDGHDEAEEIPNANGNAGSTSTVKEEDAGQMSGSPAKKRKLPGSTSAAAKRKLVFPDTSSNGNKAPAVVTVSSGSSSSSSGDDDNGEDGNEPEKILNATDISGKLLYLVKYKGANQLRRVSADKIHSQFPRVALAFYVERRAWEVPI